MQGHSSKGVIHEQQPIGRLEPQAGALPGIEKTSYQRKTFHESTTPLTSAVSVTQGSGDFNRRAEMAEVQLSYFLNLLVLPRGTIANTQASTEGNYVDEEGQPVTYRRELITSVNPNSESTLLKEEEKRIAETPLEPGVISRYYSMLWVCEAQTHFLFFHIFKYRKSVAKFFILTDYP
ncbi:unnamed protein product [Gongylonema pulchrum]|uniref:Uncharacterized protein n=1 Tax=Gongylonema pulchrum TaxID=637853 RepID=A0A183DVA3_9BILA|nr:unnamed protein product [Gongylonema pulchrum]